MAILKTGPQNGVGKKLSKLREIGARGTLKHAKLGENAKRLYRAFGGPTNPMGDAGSVGGGPAKHNLAKKKSPSKGGKGSTVNVIVMSKEGGAGGPPIPGGAMHPPVPPPPMPHPMAPPGPMAGPGGPPGGPPIGPMAGGPPMMHRDGGRVKRSTGGRLVSFYAFGGKVKRKARKDGGSATDGLDGKGAYGDNSMDSGEYVKRAKGGKVAAKEEQETHDEDVKLPKGMKGEERERDPEEGYDAKVKSPSYLKRAGGGEVMPAIKGHKMKAGASSGVGLLEKQGVYGAGKKIKAT